MAQSRGRSRAAAPATLSSWAPCLIVSGLVALSVGFFFVGPVVNGTGDWSALHRMHMPSTSVPSGRFRAVKSADRSAPAGSPPLAVPVDGPPPAPSCPAVPAHIAESLMSGGEMCVEDEADAKRLAVAGLPPVSDELPPKIKPSLYGRVHGKEPFERASNAEWELHTIPTTQWVDSAKAKIDRCPVDAPWPGTDGYAQEDITWVSLLLDLKRGESGNDQFRRSMQEYYDRFQRILDRGFKMVIFIPKEFESHLKLDKTRIKVIHFTAADLAKYFPYYDRLTAVRTSDVWNRQAVITGWLDKAPQARLPLYDPLVMSKINLLRDVARLNPWKTKRLMFMDAGHYCAVGLKPGEMPVFHSHMDKFFLTHWPYGTTTEVHGMLDKAMHLYMGTAQDPLRIVRGGVFGGERAFIECVAKVYNTALAQTLRDGYLGTEENIFAMIYQRFPDLFHGFDNNSLGNHGDNCAAFQANEIEVKKLRQAGKL